VPKDTEQAILWFERAANAGHIRAMVSLAEIYALDPAFLDAELSFDWNMRAAAQADSPSMVNVGFAYDEGQGVKVNYDKALDWYQRAAKLGNVVAMNNIGVLYSNGKGVRQDYSVALEWFERAVAANDYGLAHFNIAISYRDGLGIAPDAKKSAEHLIAALAAGDESGLADLKDNKAMWPAKVVRSLQDQLRVAGHYKGPTDGKAGESTLDAMRKMLPPG
jgi:TPR repeat protein